MVQGRLVTAQTARVGGKCKLYTLEMAVVPSTASWHQSASENMLRISQGVKLLMLVRRDDLFE